MAAMNSRRKRDERQVIDKCCSPKSTEVNNVCRTSICGYYLNSVTNSKTFKPGTQCHLFFTPYQFQLSGISSRVPSLKHLNHLSDRFLTYWTMRDTCAPPHLCAAAAAHAKVQRVLMLHRQHVEHAHSQAV
jgi:hypothetical protein